MADTDVSVIGPREYDLKSLAEQINKAHDDAKSAFTTGVQRALACGKHLLRAKELAGQGHYLEWLSANTRIGERQAERYMMLAIKEQTLLAKTGNNLSGITMTGAIALIQDLRDPG